MESQPSPEAMTRTWDWGDRVATEFEEALRRSERPSIRAELERIKPEDRPRVLPELVGLEIVYRRRAGEDVSLTDYEPIMSELGTLDPADRANLLEWIERSSTDDTSPGPAHIGRYTIVATLDKGGQAQTFRAVHPGFQHTVVLKLAHRPADPGMLDRIATEGRLLASLPPHRHLVKVHDVDLHEGRVFLVLEDVPGSTLEQYARDRPLDARWAAQIVAAIARAIHLAHEQGVTHLDLNPRNVLIDREGQPRVIDFGMAWHRPWWTEASDSAPIGGTPPYLSPEQAWGQSDRIGRTTDVFGLGGILFFLLTGSPLYPGDQLLTILNRAREVDFDRRLLNRPGIPSRLRAICLESLASEPFDRFITSAELAQALERFLVPRRLGYWAMLAAVFVLAFGLAWGIRPRRPAETASPSVTVQPALQIRIWRPETEFQPLLKALPIRSGDEVQVRCRVPKGQAVTMYLVNTMGRLRELKQYPTADDDREITYPEVGKTQLLEGQPGTEMILALGGSGGDVSDEVQRSWNSEAGDAPWPGLPPGTTVRLSADRVEFEGDRNRELTEIRDRTNPGERVWQRLDALRKRLHDQYLFVEGVAFGRE